VTRSPIRLALIPGLAGFLAFLYAPAIAAADITNGGAHAQQIFDSWARPLAACIIVVGAIRAIARRNLVGVATFLALVLLLGGFVLDPERGLSISNSLLSQILG
jgi:hypothetical protein